MKAAPHLALLTTGGTIAARAASAGATTGYAIDPAGPDLDPDLAAALDGVARLTTDAVCRLPSSDLGAGELLHLARRATLYLADPAIAGVIVTHGTDTLEETALFLDLLLPSGKPVVLTGAMRPAGALGADGPRNLLNAMRIAVAPEVAGRGVLVTMDDRILAASAARKRHTTALAAFQPAEDGQLGAIIADRVVFAAPAAPRGRPRFDIEANTALPSVDILYAHQDAPGYLFDASIGAGARGLVLACTGNGTLSAVAREGVARAHAQGLVVVRASRTGAGHVSWPSLPGIPAGPFNPQQARIVLMLALQAGHDAASIARIFAAG